MRNNNGTIQLGFLFVFFEKNCRCVSKNVWYTWIVLFFFFFNFSHFYFIMREITQEFQNGGRFVLFYFFIMTIVCYNQNNYKAIRVFYFKFKWGFFFLVWIEGVKCWFFFWLHTCFTQYRDGGIGIILRRITSFLFILLYFVFYN